MHSQPSYTLDKIRFATDHATFERAVDLYEGGKVKDVKADGVGYSATVVGSQSYRVYVHAKTYDRGGCDCYLGQKDVLCKHMVALAISVVKNGQPLELEEKQIQVEPACSGRLGELTAEALKKTKTHITTALRYVKTYRGPSRTWFAYQDSLSEGCRRLSPIVSNIPVSKQTAGVLVDLLLRLDKKLCEGGVDDSDGTVSGFMYEVVEVLKEFARLDDRCIDTFSKIVGTKTCFEWDESLIRILDEASSIGVKS